MSHSNGIITSPVTTEDISQTLGVASRQVGYLCSNEHGQINRWSRCKPVKVNKRVPLTAGNFKDLRYGFTLPNFNVNGGDAWVYNPPLGEDKGYFRMLDFNGYNHNAIIPCQHYFPPFIYLDRTYEYQLTFDEYTTDGLSDWDDASMINLVDLFYDRTYLSLCIGL